MTVLAVGATGHFAHLVVPALKARGLRVRALVRDPGKADEARANGADEVVVADLDDRASLDPAVEGCDGVFHLNPAFAPTGTAMGLAMVDAAQRSGSVSRFVFSGVYHPSLSLDNHASTRPVEEALYGSDLAFTVLQPAMFLQGLGVADAVATGRLAAPWSRHSRMSYVDYRDVAEVAATALATNELAHGTFELCSAGMWDRVTVAELITAVAGHPVQAEQVDPAVPPGPMGDGLRAMFAEYDDHGFHGGNDLVLRTLLDREPHGVASYVRETVAAL